MNSDGGHSLFGSIPFDRLGDLETDDIDDNASCDSSDSQFDTEPLDSSSSNGENLSVPSSPERMVRKRHVQSTASDDSNYSDINADSEVLNWFINGPFKYNVRVAAIALPGLIMVLMFSGEMLLAFSAVGSLIVCLLYSSGNQSRALVAYLIMFIIIQITVVYSVIPLIWKSLLNVFLIFSLNMYTFLTGGWILLQFENFKFRDPELLTLLESSLFTVYPICFVIQITWLLGAMTTVAIAPYLFMLLGFIVLQVFMTPVQSSYVKPHAQGGIAVWDAEGYVLSPVAIATMATVYTFSGPLLVLLLHFVAGWKSFLSMLNLVQCLFIGSSSVFLATFLHLRLFLDKTGISHRALLIVRWSAAVVLLVLIGPLLYCYDVQSTLLPWIPFVVVTFIGLVFALLRRNQATAFKVMNDTSNANTFTIEICTICLTSCVIGVRLSLATLSLVMTGIFYQLPWHLNFTLVSSGVSLPLLQTCLFGNAVICCVTIYGATYWSADVLGVWMVIQSLGHTILSSMLLTDRLLPLLLIVVLTALYCYTSLREAQVQIDLENFWGTYHRVAIYATLFHSNHLPCKTSLLLNTLHIASTVSVIGRLYGHVISSCGVVGQLFNFSSTFALLYILLDQLVYSHDELTNWLELLKPLTGLVMAQLACCPLLITDILHEIFLDVRSLAYLGFIGLTTSVVLGKLLYVNGCATVRQHKFSLLTVASLSSVAVLILQPQASLDREDVQKWAVLVCLICVVSAAPLAAIYKQYIRIVSAALGLPLGIGIFHAVLPSWPSVSLQLTFGILAVLCLTLLLTVWHQPRNADDLLKITAILIGACCGTLSLLEAVSTPSIDVENLGWLHRNLTKVTAVCSLLFVAATLHIHLRTDKQCDLDPSSSERKARFLPLVGNLYTLIVFVILCTGCCPEKLESVWYLWACVASTVFVSFNRDKYLLSCLSRGYRVAPVVTSVTVILYAAVLYECALFTGVRIFNRFVGILELLTVLGSLPVAAMLLMVLWNISPFYPDVLVVFTAPMYVVLFLVGSEYSSWVLAPLGLVSSYWLMKYKLKFENDV